MDDVELSLASLLIAIGLCAAFLAAAAAGAFLVQPSERDNRTSTTSPRCVASCP